MGAQLTAFADVQPVGDDEEVLGVVVDLGSLARVEHVLDGEHVQAQLLPYQVELGLVDRAQVEPERVRRVLQALGDLLDREALGSAAPRRGSSACGS